MTPICLLLLFLLAFLVRPLIADRNTTGFFIPALSLKFIGAIMLGVIYQFYYGGGDTFNFYNGGTRYIWSAFQESPLLGFKMIFLNLSNPDPEVFSYWSRIWYKNDSSSYFVSRVAGFFDIFTLHTYSATALFFAFFSFLGLWGMYRSFYRAFPTYNKRLAYAILFVPSVFFWGSGILKDTLTLGALGLANYALFNIFQFRRRLILSVMILIFSSWILISLKIYILLSLLLAVSVWLFTRYSSLIRNTVLRIMLLPMLLLVFAGGGYALLSRVSQIDERYALDNIGRTAQVTAYDIRYGWGARTGDGSGYTLGELDGSMGSLLQLAPKAIVVSLFRPFLWEVKNPLMLLSAIESLVVTILTLQLIYRGRLRLVTKSPILIYCLTFSLLFAFAVGVSTYNFGTLARYKIPLMPYYFTFLVILRR